MTNERWRAEMPKWWHRDVDAIVTRANAELDAAEARESKLKAQLDESEAELMNAHIELRRHLSRVEDSEREKAALTKERDELRSMLVEVCGLDTVTNGTFSPDDAVTVTRIRFAEYREEAATNKTIITSLESELAARRASDEDVRECAESMRFYRPGAPEAASRLLAADWLKKEGGS